MKGFKKMDELFSAERVNAQTIQLTSGQRLSAVHKASQCEPRNCPLHRPSEHEYRDLPLFFTGTYMVRLAGEISDEHPTGEIIDPDDYEYNRSGKAILRNSAFCKGCGEEIVSVYRHDFVTCPCGNVSVDGGGAYLRRVTKGTHEFKDTSVVVTKPETDKETV
jgi:hypothetical protein